MRCNFVGCYRDAGDEKYCELHNESGKTLDAITSYYREKSEKIINDKTKERLRKLKQNKLYNTAAWRRLRQEIFLERDFCCEKCGAIDNLEAHHVISSDDESLFFNKDNLIILCSECHRKITMQQIRNKRNG